MTSSGPARPLDHTACWELIPWFVNGSLTDEELAKFEPHVGTCDTCQREIAEQRHLARELVQLDDASPTDVDRGWSRLLAALDAPAGTVARPRMSTRRLLVAAAVLQIALFGALVGVIGWLHGQRPEAPFHTLSSPIAAPSSDGMRIRLVPTPQASVSQLEAALLPLHGRIVDGPTQGGVFTVVVPAAQGDHAILSLREQPFILLAEPLPAGEP